MMFVCFLAPNGDQVPARLLPQQDGNYKVEWTPAMAGLYPRFLWPNMLSLMIMLSSPIMLVFLITFI